MAGALDIRGIKYVVAGDNTALDAANARSEAGVGRLNKAAEQSKIQFLAFGKAGEVTARQLQALGYQTSDVITQLASGQTTWLVALQQGLQLRDQFGGFTNVFRAVLGALTPMRLAAIGATGALGTLAAAFLLGRTEIDDFNKKVALTGNVAAITKAEFDAMAQTIARGSGNTIGRAKDSLLQLVSSGQFSAATMVDVGRAALVMQRLTGESIDDVTKRFLAAGNGVSRWAADANRSYNYLNAAQFEYIRTLEQQGRLQEAARENFRLLGETLEKRVIEPTNGLQLSLKIGAELWDKFWNAAKGGLAPETIEDRLRKANEALERRSSSGGFFFGGSSFGAAAEQQFSLAKQVFRQNEVADRARDAALQNQKDIEKASKAHQDALLRIAEAGIAQRLAKQQAGIAADQRTVRELYSQFEISPEENREYLTALGRLGLDAEESAIRARMALEEGRKLEGSQAEIEQQKLAKKTALIGLDTQLVNLAAKRAKYEEDVANFVGETVSAARQAAFDPAQEFRNLERAQQAAVDGAFARGPSAARGIAAEFARTNAELTAQTIADDRARGLALIEIEIDAQRRRLQIGLTTADEFKALEDGLADYRIARNRQLTEQLKPEWQRQLELYADTTRHMAQSFDAAMNTATRSSEDAWVDMVTNGEFSAKRLVQAINEQLARIGWQKYLAQPAANVFEQFFRGLFGGFGSAGSGNLSEVGGLGAFVYHGGGVAGTGARRRVPASLFAGAPRYHAGGLAGDEVPAILQRGERVLPRGASAGGVTINANFYPPGGQSPAAFAAAVGPQLRQLKAEVISELARPGTAAFVAARR